MNILHEIRNRYRTPVEARVGWLIFFLMLSSQVWAQQQLDGVVVDRDTGKPVPFASLVILGTSNGTSTNLNGQFSLILADTFSVKVTCVGYESALIRSVEEAQVIKLKAIATHLDAVLVYNKAMNPNKIVRKAFAGVSDNYDTRSFLQKFFYRHYSKTDSAYERLTEAAVDVWKHDGYRITRKYSGEKEEVRINQLRRSLDIKGMVQAQKPLHLSYILQTDIVGYQNGVTGARLNAMEEVSNMKADILNYSFTFDGTTNYDGLEVYKIDFVRKADSVLTTSGYRVFPETSGSLFIATDNYAFVKTEVVKRDEFNTIRSTAYYRKYGTKYYPYHLIREGESHFQGVRSFHVELMSQEIRHGEHEQFTGREPGREALLQIPYDSGFWSSTSILKTTPLEDDIIRDLGAGISLNKQFYLYRLYEQNVTDGGKNGEEKFNWLKNDSKNKRVLYLCFWDNHFKSYLELEYVKHLIQQYRNQVTFVLISLVNEEAVWNQQVIQHNLFSDGIVNYWVGSDSELAKQFKVKETPAYILISKQGDVDQNAKAPRDPLLREQLKLLISDQE